MVSIKPNKKNPETKLQPYKHIDLNKVFRVFVLPILLVVIIYSDRLIPIKTVVYAQKVETITSQDLELLDYTNNQRHVHNLSTLKLNNKLNSAAQAKANDMSIRNYWSHTAPDGKEPWDFISATGYDYIKAGENLAYGYPSYRDVINGWMLSKLHRDNILDPTFNEMGFGVKDSLNYMNTGPQTIVVVLYGRR